ncbi:hypothetical protein ACLOJK_029191 [Asimina triloba]
METFTAADWWALRMGCRSGMTGATLDEMGFNPSGYGFLPFDECDRLRLLSVDLLRRPIVVVEAGAIWGPRSGLLGVEELASCLGWMLPGVGFCPDCWELLVTGRMVGFHRSTARRGHAGHGPSGGRWFAAHEIVANLRFDVVVAGGHESAFCSICYYRPDRVGALLVGVGLEPPLLPCFEDDGAPYLGAPVVYLQLYTCGV